MKIIYVSVHLSKKNNNKQIKKNPTTKTTKNPTKNVTKQNQKLKQNKKTN